MKRTNKTQIVARVPAGRCFRGLPAALLPAFTLIFPAAGPARAAGLQADAQAVLDALDRRIAAAEASQASRDRFLEALHPEAACRDWTADIRLRRDPDLRAVLAEACPEPAAPSRRRAASPAGTAAARPARAAGDPRVTYRVRASQEVRPREAGLEGPDLGGAAGRGGFEAEAASSGGLLRTRRAAYAGDAWGFRVGRLGPPSGSAPRLGFVSGRGRFAGWSGRSGVDGALEAHVPALDGASFALGPARLAAGGFASWNRLLPASGEDGIRRDAVAHGLSLGGRAGEGDGAGDPEWTLELLHHAVETGGAPPPRAWVGGAGLAWPGGSGLGLAASVLDAGRDPPRTSRLRTGLYGEAVLADGTRDGYRVEARQASPGWADALSGTPAHRRDTVGDLILPGRGEGALDARARVDLHGGDDARDAMEAWLDAGGAAAWILGTMAGQDTGTALPLDDGATSVARLLGGEGRASLHLAREGWSLAGNASLRWRSADLPASGAARTLGLSGSRELGRWRLRVSLARREGPSYRDAWPGALEAAWRGPEGNAAAATLSLTDARSPGRGLRAGLRQTWRLGRGIAMTQDLRLPWRAGGLEDGVGIQLRLEWRPGSS